MKIKGWDKKLRETLVIMHDFDIEKLLLVSEDKNRNNLYRSMIDILEIYYSYEKNHIPSHNTNIHSFGKILVKVCGLYNVYILGKVFFRLKIGKVKFDSREIEMKENHNYEVA
jgi:hypothetical protein